MSSNEEFIRKNKVVIIDDDKNTKLHYAAALGNLEEIDKIIASKQKLDPENYLGWTPLMMAIRNANALAVDTLLIKGADATKKNKFGINAFLISVTCGDIVVVEKLLNHLLTGGVSRQSLQRLFSPVSLAILYGHNHIFKYLLERSFDPNAAAPLTGITPLMFAAALGKEKLITKLLNFKANIHKKNHLGKTAVDIAHTRHNSVETNFDKTKARPQPLIIITSHNQNSPHLQLTPYPEAMGRKSSNTRTPSMVCTPRITPITPQFMPQMFFGSNFTPSQFISPGPPMAYHSFLNAAVTPSNFVSPLPSPQICYPNYV
ncbi:hypothetical protein Zmor_015248 [Zophobas morio]|uniref:Uncharacterized protein n=1 Tax=Zophobas morio TaxID=2755281 RepID=A0AA38MH22_9CUCU|nr:hypothetical protein Zmor_015248 [Zophobas morio]